MGSEYLLSVIVLSLLLVLILVIFWSKSKSIPQRIAEDLYIEGLSALAQGNQQLAYQKFRSVVQQDTENVDAYLKIGDLLRGRGKAEKALQIHKELAIRPNLSDAKREEIHKSLAEDFVAVGQFQRAVDTLEDLWKGNKDSLDTGERLLSAYEKLGNWEKAVEVEERMMKLKGERVSHKAALYWVMQGRHQAGKGDFHQARVSYKEALNFDPQCVPAYLYLGQAYVADRRLDEAVEQWKRILEQAPQWGYLVYPQLEKVLYDLGRYGEIVNIYQGVLENYPEEVRTMYALANIFGKRGNHSLAKDTLQGIIELKPDYYPALGDLIGLYLKNGMYAEAKSLLEQFKDSLPGENSHLACKSCGETSSVPPWRCSTCGRVNVY